MTPAEMEAELIRLKNRVAELSQVQDYMDICKLQSTYAHIYFMLKRKEIANLFAQKTPGVSMEIEDSGVYEGIESVRRFWTTVLTEERHSKMPGWLAIHMTCNPIIEINKQGTRAKGVWFSHGSVSLKVGDKLEPMICLGKYDMEYVKEDGQWKFLKLAYRIAYMCHLQKGWVDEPTIGSIAGSPENRPDKPTTWHLPYYKYRINTFPPPPPEPYKE